MRLIPSYNEVKNRRTKNENFDVWNICTDKFDPKLKDNEDNELDSKNSTNVVPIDNTRIGIIQTITNISIPHPKQAKEPSTINKCLIERKNAITPEEPTINNNHYMNPAATHNNLAIVGGPGVGKTTVCQLIYFVIKHF